MPAALCSDTQRFAARGAPPWTIAALVLALTLVPMSDTRKAVAYVIAGPIVCAGAGWLLSLGPTAGLARALAEWARSAVRWVANLPRMTFLAVVFSASLTIALTTSYLLMANAPGVFDGALYLFQAKILASGHFAAHVPRLPEFFPATFALLDGDRWYTQYPPGYPALLAIGVLVGWPSLVNPLALALNAVLVYQLAKEAGSEGESRVAALIAGFTPFGILMSSDYTSHPTSLLFATAFMLGVAIGIRTHRSLPFAWAGFAGAFCFTIRPYSAVGICAVFAGVGLVSIVRYRLWRAAVGGLIGASLPLIFFLLYNVGTTGEPFLLGYTKLQGAGHVPGFGDTLWGTHTVANGIRNTLTNLNAFNKDLLQLPFPSLALVAFYFGPARRNRWDWWLLLSFGCLAAVSAAYAYQSLYLGPKFLFEGIGVISILSAKGSVCAWRSLASVADRPLLLRRIVLAMVVAIAIIWPAALGARLWVVWKGYADPTITLAVSREQLRDALVFVPLEQDWRAYAACFAENAPGLDGSVVYAADRGRDNARLMALYPRRDYYLWTDGELQELSRPL